MNINDALSTLDPTVDEHWTGDGLPRIDVVAKATGKDLKRADITNAAPDFNRDAALRAKVEAAAEADRAARAAEAPAPEPSKADEPIATAPAEHRPAPDELELLNAECAEAEAEVLHLQEYIDRAKDQLDKAQRRRDRLLLKRENAAPRHKVESDIRHYLDSQQRQNLARGQAQMDLKAAGIDVERLKKLTNGGASQLDASMARKSGHGLNRPQPRVPGSAPASGV